MTWQGAQNIESGLNYTDNLQHFSYVNKTDRHLWWNSFEYVCCGRLCIWTKSRI